MTETVLSSASREVVIGFGRPFVIIGERINPTGRKLLAAEMAEGDYSRVESDTLAQVAAGAHMLDVNAGIPMIDESIDSGTSVTDCTSWMALASRAGSSARGMPALTSSM